LFCHFVHIADIFYHFVTKLTYLSIY